MKNGQILDLVENNKELLNDAEILFNKLDHYGYLSKNDVDDLLYYSEPLLSQKGNQTLRVIMNDHIGS